MLGVSLAAEEAAGGRWLGKCSVCPCARQATEGFCALFPFANTSAGQDLLLSMLVLWPMMSDSLSFLSPRNQVLQAVQRLWGRASQGLGLLRNTGPWRSHPVLHS